jgi:hypothetical protein|tara:strand:- start:206 stop:331 length:126 start_codon:yes stop_codon:yes gene_type:complete
MEKLIKKYEVLETKQENGTITMDEDAIRVKLYQMIQDFLSK